jgi:hypothetical protein
MDDQPQRESFCIDSTIRSELLNHALKRGAWFGGGGASLILGGGIFFPLELLQIWGVPLFGLGLLFIGVGLRPYRQLCKLQMKPHSLHIDDHYLLFLKNGKPLFKISLTSIEKVLYVEKKRLYGLAIWLKRPIAEKVKVLEPNFDFAAFAFNSMQHFEGCDLFLPYFSDRAYDKFKDQLG